MRRRTDISLLRVRFLALLRNENRLHLRRETEKCMKSRSNDKLLHVRELCGKVIASRKGKLNFQTEFLKKQASYPLIWKYDETQRVVDSALEHLTVNLNMPEGLLETDILLTGGVNGSLSYLLEVGKAGQEFNQGVECVPYRVWPLKAGYGEGYCDSPGHVWRPPGACVHMPSNISCIKMSQKHPASISDASSKHVLITTLGAESYGGTVNILNLSEPLDLFTPTFRSRISEITSFEHTIWTADCSHDQKQAVVGTNRGANPGFKSSVRDSFQIKGKMHHRNAISMPSSVCCLASLRLYDQCFLASSMDGSIKLYDHRLIRGPIQSYEGINNSHSRIQFGVDPSETIVMSGGVDCHLRLWSIKSGELLFDNKFMDTIPSVVRWPKTEGLMYLHTFSKRCLIHRDVKSSNILLDQSMCAKIVDFGFSKYASHEGDSGTSLEVRVTAGYLDPEYYSTQHLSAKSDVFSFGVVLLEIPTGREPLNINKPRNEWSLVEWAKPLIRSSRVEEIVDPAIKGGYHGEALWRVVEVALACTETYSTYRPCIADIVRELEDALIIENNASEYLKSLDSFGGSNRFSIERSIVLPPIKSQIEPSSLLSTPAPPQPR
ncbi:hypothetical protein K7X08_018518 [Anisodus acutangulus]|uniref:Protein kinase domain-containing protein n=1 Tax=Anisodus acutangulus TaxID=402998 RepID=A0A9Q1LZS0_9SOLA|nr:hypothetical protein K7X08_018518 [Anisodus acutangulus]